MCGRYTLKTDAHALQAELGLDELPVLHPRYNLAPTQAAPIVTNAAPGKLTLAQWGLIPHWAKDPAVAHKMINARAESLAQKPAFKEALARRRCLVPADGFYEWKHAGRSPTPMYITLESKAPFTFAGLWETWRAPHGLEVVSFTIITTTPNPLMAPIHDRMPVILDGPGRQQWLRATEDLSSLLGLLVPWHHQSLTAREVSPHVNSVAVDDPRCIEPATSTQLTLL